MRKAVFFVLVVIAVLAAVVHQSAAKKHEVCEDEENQTKPHALKRDHHHHQKDANRNRSKHRKRNKELIEEEDEEGVDRFRKEKHPSKWASKGHKHNLGQDGLPGNKIKKERRNHRHDGTTQDKVKFERKHIRQSKDRKLGKHGNKEWRLETSTETKQPYPPEVHTEKPIERPDNPPDIKTSQQTTPLPVQTDVPSFQIDQQQLRATGQPRQDTSSNEATTDLSKIKGLSSCSSHAACEEGFCCHNEKGMCQKYDTPEGQNCWDTCACAGGLLCYAETQSGESKRGNALGVCKAPDPEDLTKGTYLKQ